MKMRNKCVKCTLEIKFSSVLLFAAYDRSSKTCHVIIHYNVFSQRNINKFKYASQVYQETYSLMHQDVA